MHPSRKRFLKQDPQKEKKKIDMFDHIKRKKLVFIERYYIKWTGKPQTERVFPALTMDKGLASRAFLMS